MDPWTSMDVFFLIFLGSISATKVSRWYRLLHKTKQKCPYTDDIAGLPNVYMAVSSLLKHFNFEHRRKAAFDNFRKHFTFPKVAF